MSNIMGLTFNWKHQFALRSSSFSWTVYHRNQFLSFFIYVWLLTVYMFVWNICQVKRYYWSKLKEQKFNFSNYFFIVKSELATGESQDEKEEPVASSSGDGSIQQQVKTLTASLVTLSQQKSKLEASYISEKRKFRVCFMDFCYVGIISYLTI